MVFHISIVFHTKIATWLAKYTCQTTDIYMARDIAVRRFITTNYDNFTEIESVTVYEPIEGRWCPHDFEVDVEEYDNSYLYNNAYFQMLSIESKIQEVEAIEEI